MNLPTQASESQHGGAINVPANSCAGGVLAYEVPLQPAERRRSSTISFERHDLSILAELAREIDDEYDDTESETESDDDDDDVIVAERPEDDGPPQSRSNADVLLNRLIQGGDHASRRVSELSLNLGDIREAVAELDDDEGEDEIRSFNNNVWSGPSHYSHYSRRSRASGSTSVSLVGQIEDDIIAKAVEKGKVAVVSDAAPRGFGVRGGYGGGRSTQSSWSGESSFSSRRWVSFVRSLSISERDGEEQSSAPPQVGTDNGTSTHSRVQDNIMAALEGLQAMDHNDAPPDNNNDGTKSDGPKETKSGDDNKEALSSEKGEARRMEAADSKSNSRASSDLVPGAAILSLRTMELSSPPPRGTRPRRSSLRNPLEHAH